MCRTATTGYKTSYVCPPCRHTAQYNPATLHTPPRCPECRRDLIHAGHDFHAPRKTDTTGWTTVAAVLATGLRYDSCGCTGPGPRPATTAQLRRLSNEAAAWAAERATRARHGNHHQQPATTDTLYRALNNQPPSPSQPAGQ